MFKILVVDHSPTMRQLLMACLASVDAHCAEASPVIACMGFRRFLLGGLHAAQGEWNLVCMACNLRRRHVLATAPG